MKINVRNLVNKVIPRQENVAISLWFVQPNGDKSPAAKGYVTINGTRYAVVLWNNQSENPRAPHMTGTLNKYSSQAVTQA